MLGFTFIYSVTGSTSFEDIKLILSASNVLDNNLYIGLFFLTLGLFGKFYIAPFHWWIMDIYEHAPSITTLYFSTVPFFSFYSILYKLYGIVFFQYNSFFVNFFLLCCFLSMFIGSIGAIMQRRLKRLIAYSSVTMLGYMLCLLVNVSNSNYLDGLHLFFFYGICVNGLFCFFFGFLFRKKTCNYHSIEDLHILSTFKSNIYSKYLVAFNLYAILGLPPMPLFFKKLEILQQLAYKDMWFLLFIFVFTSMISAYYYLYIVKMLFYTSLPSTSKNSLVAYRLNTLNVYTMVFILFIQIHLIISFFFL
jgi:NADH-quinone oxidoreductase subunit N